MKIGICQYFKSVAEVYKLARKALYSGDMEKLKQAVDELRGKTLDTEEVKHQRAKLVSQFGIES